MRLARSLASFARASRLDHFQNTSAPHAPLRGASKTIAIALLTLAALGCPLQDEGEEGCGGLADGAPPAELGQLCDTSAATPIPCVDGLVCCGRTCQFPSPNEGECACVLIPCDTDGSSDGCPAGSICSDDFPLDGAPTCRQRDVAAPTCATPDTGCTTDADCDAPQTCDDGVCTDPTATDCTPLACDWQEQYTTCPRAALCQRRGTSNDGECVLRGDLVCAEDFPACGSGDRCGGDAECRDGRCFEPGTTACIPLACDTPGSNESCPAGTTCDAATLDLSSSPVCVADTTIVCEEDVTACATSDDCPGRARCTRGFCHDANSDLAICEPIACNPDRNGQDCPLKDHTCTATDGGTPVCTGNNACEDDRPRCETSATCLASESCVEGRCAGPLESWCFPIAPTCDPATSPSPCPGGTTCVASVGCVDSDDAAAGGTRAVCSYDFPGCTSAADCPSGSRCLGNPGALFCVAALTPTSTDCSQLACAGRAKGNARGTCPAGYYCGDNRSGVIEQVCTTMAGLRACDQNLARCDADAQCLTGETCLTNTCRRPEICDNGVDDDGDNFEDCNDTDCEANCGRATVNVTLTDENDREINCSDPGADDLSVEMVLRDKRGNIISARPSTCADGSASAGAPPGEYDASVEVNDGLTRLSTPVDLGFAVLEERQDFDFADTVLRVDFGTAVDDDDDATSTGDDDDDDATSTGDDDDDATSTGDDDDDATSTGDDDDDDDDTGTTGTPVTCTPSSAASSLVGDFQRVSLRLARDPFGAITGCLVETGEDTAPGSGSVSIAVFYTYPLGVAATAAAYSNTGPFTSTTKGTVNGSALETLPFATAFTVVQRDPNKNQTFTYTVTLTGTKDSFSMSIPSVNYE